MIKNYNELEEGMVLGKSVYYGDNLILEKGEKLTSKAIDTIKKYKILKVEIKDEDVFEQEEKISKKFNEHYKKNLEASKKIIEKMDDGEFEKEELQKIIDTTIADLNEDEDILIRLLKNKKEKNYIFQHSLNSMAIASIIGKSLGYDDERLKKLAKGAFLHDVGMLKIDDNIVNKKEKLSDEEREKIQEHTKQGVKMLEDLDLDEDIIDIIKHHHEKIDGSGYPDGLEGDEISEEAKIMAIADIYSALTEERQYRNKFIYYDAMKMIMESATKKIDHKIIKKFLKKMPIYPINSVVKLNTGDIATVVKANDNPFRPVVDVQDENGKTRVDLSHKKHLTKYIEGIKK
ncbi:MAG: HD-GYP domain-containing protein [Fusobacteriota bacterium]